MYIHTYIYTYIYIHINTTSNFDHSEANTLTAAGTSVWFPRFAGRQDCELRQIPAPVVLATSCKFFFKRYVK